MLILQKGDKGGYIEHEGNLSQYGDSRVLDGAEVSGDAVVDSNAKVFGNARLWDNVWVSGNAWVYGNAKVSGNAWVYGNAKVSGDALIHDNALVYGNAVVSFGKCTEPVINLINLCKFNITSYNEYIKVGCKEHTKKEWLHILEKGEYKEECKDTASYNKLNFYIYSLCTEFSS